MTAGQTRGKKPQTISATYNINALWGKKRKWQKFFSCELRLFPPKDHPVLLRQSNPEGPYPTVRKLLYWQSACFSTLQILCGEQLLVDFATGWWSLLLIWPHNATHSQNCLGESPWHIQFNQGAGHYICGLWSYNLLIPTPCICQCFLCADGW